MSSRSLFDDLLDDEGPAALVIREHLMPVEGRDAVLFPATFAPGSGNSSSGGYHIDGDPNGTNVCLIDSVGSQANRIEPVFAKEKYAGLIPQITVTAGTQVVSIVDVGHRAGDAMVRCSELQKELHDAFQAVLRGDAEPIARIAPTSLVFGVWDSRDTQAKLPRVLASTIRAFDVRKMTRSAQYAPPVDYSKLEVFSEEEKSRAEGDTKNPLARRGFVHIPTSVSHGGIIATGGIRRDATLGLAALRLLSAGSPERTLALRRYVLGLALTAFTYNPSGYLRQGCLLVRDPERATDCEFVAVYPTGERRPASITHDQAFFFAEEAAWAFGLDPDREIKASPAGPDRSVEFDKERARNDVRSDTETRSRRKSPPRSKSESAEAN